MALAGLAASPHSCATEEEVTVPPEIASLLDQKIEIATGHHQLLSRAPIAATVITAEDIKAMGATTLEEVLETVPGMHVSRTFNFHVPIYVVRGMYTQQNPQVLMLINGISIATVVLGNHGHGWHSMPLAMVARIEVIRGPGLALQGADAFAGVINIITKNGEDLRTREAGMRLGNFALQEYWVLHGTRWRDFDISFGLDYRSTKGGQSRVESDAQTLFDTMYGTQVSQAPGALNDQVNYLDAHLDIARDHWRARLMYVNGKVGSGAGTAQALAPSSYYSLNRLLVDLTWANTNCARDWSCIAQISYFELNQRHLTHLMLFPAGAFDNTFPDGVIGNPDYYENRWSVGWLFSYTGLPNNRWRFGMGYNYSDVYRVEEEKNFTYDPVTGALTPVGALVDVTDDAARVWLPEANRRNAYVLVQDEWLITPDWELDAGLRYDHYSDFGHTVNPRLGLIWQARRDLNIKLLYARAFRAPSFVELYNRHNPVILGNPTLQPEKLTNIELLFNYKPSKQLDFGFGTFRYRWRDVIQEVRDPVPGLSATAQNVGKQTGYGLEAELRWQASEAWRWIGNVSWQRSYDEQARQSAGNSPERQLYARAEWRWAASWMLVPQVKWVLDRRRAPGDPRPALADYALTDITLRRRVARSPWEFALSMRNIFDVTPREPSPGPNTHGYIFLPYDLPLAGRSVYGEIRYRW